MTASSDPAKAVVGPDSYLTLHYRIELVTGPGAGTVFIDTFAERPATLQMGVGQWAPGLEQALLGHEEGSRFRVDLPAAQAYGEHNAALVQRVADETIQADAEPGTVFEPGDIVELVSPQGGRYSGVFKEQGPGWALLDFNHPLAGVDLRIDVALLGVL